MSSVPPPAHPPGYDHTHEPGLVNGCERCEAMLAAHPQDELDEILTAFLTFTLGNEAIEANPTFARAEARAALLAYVDRQRAEALRDRHNDMVVRLDAIKFEMSNVLRSADSQEGAKQ